MNNKTFDIIIVGGGVLGTFHAYHALQNGLSVALLEKNAQPLDATVRNFGQVVPSGMNLKWQNFGRESLSIYKSIQSQFDVSIRQNGTIYIASNDEELQLIEELHDINTQNNYQSQLLTKEACLNKYQGLKSSYCKAGLFFPEEVTVEPNVMIHRLRTFMVEQMGLYYAGNTAVVAVEEIND
jgi:FAD dependent oxidoreductase TIGR03364